MDSTQHNGDISNSAHALGQPAVEKRIMHYFNLHHILLVGEGDFSFSAALAIAFGSAENIVATSLDSREVVISSYNSGQNNIRSLEKRRARILHSVDAKTMKKHEILREMLFDRIVYNFPHAGFYGKEDDNKLIQKHRHLLKMFLKNAKAMLNENGEIHVTHKEGDPYDQWKLVEQAQECGLVLKESVEFNKADYPGYTNRRGAGPNIGQTFTFGECKTYMLILRESMSAPTRLTEFSSQVHPGSLKAAILELESERQNRKAAETAKKELESSKNHLTTVLTKTLTENDEVKRQRDEAFREKTIIAGQLAEALRLKEDAHKQKDMTILELESERQNRKAAETAKKQLESSLNHLTTVLTENDEVKRQRDKAFREKTIIAGQLAEALRLKEDAHKQKDMTIMELTIANVGLERRIYDVLYQAEAVCREKENISRQLAESLRLAEAATNEKEKIVRECKDITNRNDENICWTIVVIGGLAIWKIFSMYRKK